MFAIGEMIVYGSEGVFTVIEYTDSPIDKNDTRVFYVLRPRMGTEGNRVITPSEGGVTPMRSVISREEAQALIEKIPEIGIVEVANERLRRETYRGVMSCGKAESMVSIIKTVKERRISFAQQKRRLSETDADFESRAKHCLYSELSVALDIPYSEVEEYISKELS
jgi:CarD family transcriptional regulator